MVLLAPRSVSWLAVFASLVTASSVLKEIQPTNHFAGRSGPMGFLCIALIAFEISYAMMNPEFRFTFSFFEVGDALVCAGSAAAFIRAEEITSAGS